MGLINIKCIGIFPCICPPCQMNRADSQTVNSSTGSLAHWLTGSLANRWLATTVLKTRFWGLCFTISFVIFGIWGWPWGTPTFNLEIFVDTVYLFSSFLSLNSEDPNTGHNQSEKKVRQVLKLRTFHLELLCSETIYSRYELCFLSFNMFS